MSALVPFSSSVSSDRSSRPLSLTDRHPPEVALLAIIVDLEPLSLCHPREDIGGEIVLVESALSEMDETGLVVIPALNHINPLDESKVDLVVSPSTSM